MEPVGAKNAAVSKTSMCIIAGYVIGKNRRCFYGSCWEIWSFCRCIVGMDHHCIWINQCVGAHNHRHFFLFIVYLTGATLTIILAGFNTLYDHVYMVSLDSNSEKHRSIPLLNVLLHFLFPFHLIFLVWRKERMRIFTIKQIIEYKR